jgi:flagellar basal body-associated protein FliL
MAEERTTIIEAPNSSSGAGWVIAIVLVVALVVGAMFLMQRSGSENAKNNAITNAANQVGNAAQKAGNAAQDAADNTGNTAK